MNARSEEQRGARQLHNMSAPPRMTIVIRPLSPPADRAVPPRPRAIGSVDFAAIYRRGAAAGRWRRSADPLERLALVAEAVAGIASPRRRHRPLEEEIVDRIARAAAHLDPVELGLPAVAVLARRGTADDSRPVEDPRVAVCLLTRLSGALFVARRRPHAPPRHLLERPAAFVAMETRHVHA